MKIAAGGPGKVRREESGSDDKSVIGASTHSHLDVAPPFFSETKLVTHVVPLATVHALVNSRQRFPRCLFYVKNDVFFRRLAGVSSIVSQSQKQRTNKYTRTI